MNKLSFHNETVKAIDRLSGGIATNCFAHEFSALGNEACQIALNHVKVGNSINRSSVEEYQLFLCLMLAMNESGDLYD
jgi:hypothetical protein